MRLSATRTSGGDYLGMNRFAEAKAVREKQVAANLDAALDHARLVRPRFS